MVDQFNILDYTDGPLLKTGNTIDQTPAGRTTKDDGGFQRGVAGSKADRQYEILTTGQYSGTSNITVNGFTDAHTNECVFDKVTGLMWNRELSSLIYGTGVEGLFWDGVTSNNEDIFEYCDQANISMLSGFTDWRVCNRVEDSSITMFKGDNTDAIPNTTAFPVYPSSGIVWNSTSRSGTIAYGIDINSGIMSNFNKTSTRGYCSLCRLGVE